MFLTGVAVLAAGIAFAEHEKTIEMMDVSNATCGYRKACVNRAVAGGVMTVGGHRQWLGYGTHAPAMAVIPLGEG